MAFRDENTALRTKVHSLEEEVRSLRAQLDGSPSKPELAERPSPTPPSVPTLGVPGPDVGALVRERYAAERATKRAKEEAERRERRARSEKLARRPDRVHVEQTTEGLRTYIAPKFLRDALAENAGWHFWFFLINPGFFIVGLLSVALITTFGMSLLSGIVTSVVSWVLALAAGNVAYARWTNPSYVIDILQEYFAVYARSVDGDPILYGPLSELEVRLSDPDPARLGNVRIEDGRTRYDLDMLSPADVERLRGVLGAHRS